MSDAPLPEWPAPERNKGPILDVLTRVLPATGSVVEVAAGTGQHATHFAAALPALVWQPTDHDPENLAVIAERVRRAELPNLRAPLRLDASETPWPVERADAIYNANMIHIAPWEATLGLFAGTGSVLRPGGVLVTYGPYRVDGMHTSQSNARFDESLRQRDARWGVRDVTRLVEVARGAGLALIEKVPMPANNLSLVWEKRG